MQSFCLVPYLTALGNVMLPLGLQGVPRDEQARRALDALAEVGLAERANHLPRELSAGQQQRVAIARATVTRPALVLADEPTGNLDPELAHDILALLGGLNRERGLTIVMVTHSPVAAALGSVRLRMQAGAVVSSESGEAQSADSLAAARA
jgi:putative ABC transport system ATP-binding protein